MAQPFDRTWESMLLSGVAALVFGILVLLRPAISLAVLVLFFGVYALIDGIARVITALARREAEPHWPALLVSGILGIAVGVVTFFWPGVTAIALVYLIAFWAIVIGIGEISAGVRMRKVITGEWVLMLAGVLSVIFGVLIALFPGAGALALVFWIAWFAIVLGILRIALGLRLRSWTHTHTAGGAHPGAMPPPATGAA